MLKISLTLMLLSFSIVGCGHLRQMSTPPQMESKVKVWNGAPEEAGICRLSSKELRNKADLDFKLKEIKAFHQGTTLSECILATDPVFKEYACLTFQDMAVLNNFINKLILQCKEWR